MRKKTESDQEINKEIVQEKSKITNKVFFKALYIGIISGIIVPLEALVIYIILLLSTGHSPIVGSGFKERFATGALFLFIGAFIPGFGFGTAGKKGVNNLGCLIRLVVLLPCILIFTLLGSLMLRYFDIYDNDWELIALAIGCGILFGFVSMIYIKDKIDF